MKTPEVSLEDLPYTISMVATISSQHGIDRIQSNCSLSPIEYLGDNKTSSYPPRPMGGRFLLSSLRGFLAFIFHEASSGSS